jgi:hypothetical protein
MSKRTLNMSVTAMMAACVVAASSPASATPLADALAIKNATGTDVVKVWHRHGGFGWGVGAGLLGGAIIGGALAAPYYYGPGPYYYGEPYEYGPGYYPAPGYEGAYCARRYRSYDPATGTFLGYDGLRHPCP